MNGRVLAIILAILLLGGGAVYAGLQLFGGEDLPAVVYIEPEETGPDPYTSPAVFLEGAAAAPETLATTTTAAAGGTAATTTTASPATTTFTLAPGATPSPSPVAGRPGECDVGKLLDLLNQNPERKQAWLDVLGVEIADFETYLRSLSPVVTTRDVRVTYHGFREGEDRPIQAILAAGTAVLVDSEGEIVTRCYCGNPLTAPDNIEYTCEGCPDGFTPPPACNRACYPAFAITTTTTFAGLSTTTTGAEETTTTRRRTTTRVPTTARATTTRPAATQPPTTPATTFPPAATTPPTTAPPTTAATTTSEPATTTTGATTTTTSPPGN